MSILPAQEAEGSCGCSWSHLQIGEVPITTPGQKPGGSPGKAVITTLSCHLDAFYQSVNVILANVG